MKCWYAHLGACLRLARNADSQLPSYCFQLRLGARFIVADYVCQLVGDELAYWSGLRAFVSHTIAPRARNYASTSAGARLIMRGYVDDACILGVLLVQGSLLMSTRT